MLKLEIIGNLAADAVVKNSNGSSFISMRVAHSEKRQDRSGTSIEVTTWCSVSANTDRYKGVLPYLTKGKRVYIRGNMSLKTYQDGRGVWQSGINIYASELELCSSPKDSQSDQHTQANSNQATSSQAQPTTDSDLPFDQATEAKADIF